MSVLLSVLLVLFVLFVAVILGFILLNKDDTGNGNTPNKGVMAWFSEMKKVPMFWLITTLVLALVAHAIFKPLFGENIASAASAIVVGIGFHLVWWLLSEKKSWITPLFVYGIALFIVMKWWQPNDTQTIRDSSINLLGKWYGSIASTLKDIDNEKSGWTSIVSAVHKPVVLSLIAPPGKYEYRAIPQGQIVSSFDCPVGAWMSVYHSGVDKETEYDCDAMEEIVLEKSLKELRIGFKSKDEDVKYTYISLTPKKS